MNQQEVFALENFEGPLDFLLYLIQRNEIDIYAISIKAITEQYLAKLKEWTEQNVNSGAEFIGMTASLLLLKSKTLLPREKGVDQTEEILGVDLDLIEKLIEYCRFKEVAKKLSEREWNQQGYFMRETEAVASPKKIGIEHLTLQDLLSLFENVMAEAASRTGVIQDDQWLLPDAMKLLQQQLHKENRMAWAEVFSSSRSREELIVFFLALLELMKQGKAEVVRDHAVEYIREANGARN